MGIAIGLGVRESKHEQRFFARRLQANREQARRRHRRAGLFSQVMNPNDNTVLYSRAGNLSKNANGQLVIGSANTGRLLEPPIQIPTDATDIIISPEGQVSVQQPGNNQLQVVGQMQLATFINPQGLIKRGENLYQESDGSGPPTQSNPGQNGTGTIQQSMIELSNVDPANELIDMITTQRAYELNSKAIQTGDELLQVTANLKRA